MSRSLGRLTVVVGVSAGLIAALAAIYLANGEPSMSLGAVFDALGGGEAAGNGPYLVREIRLPRFLLALTCGVALGLAGVILQYTLRNPIADPGLLGISQAATTTVAISLLFPNLIPAAALPTVCLIAGIVASSLLVVLARSIRNSVRIILIGVVLASLGTTVTASILVLLPPDRTTGLAGFFTFTAGSVAAGTWTSLRLVLPWVVVAIPVALVSGRALNLLQLGDDVAQGRGMKVTRTRALLLLAAALLVAPMVAVVGPVSFVALLSPHVARGLLGTSNAHVLLPGSAAVGAVVVVLADTVGRLLFFPLEIPAGLWTILVIGPTAVWMASRSMRRTAPAEGVA